MRIPGVSWGWSLIRAGQGRYFIEDLWLRCYKRIQEFIFTLRFRVFGKLPPVKEFNIRLETQFPLAYKSPDHLIPWGTMRDNSTNKRFVMVMRERVEREFAGSTCGALDLGCSGGQLVADFRSLGWLAVGLEGSDFSLKHGRANWPSLAGKNLFTCDIAKPFGITVDGTPAQFNLITMWEVLEHIPTPELPQLFDNISKHLAAGGYFVASTTSAPDVHDGVDLHQTKWPNDEWRRWIGKTHPDFEPVDLGLKPYHWVQHNMERSYLTFRKRRQ